MWPRVHSFDKSWECIAFISIKKGGLLSSIKVIFLLIKKFDMELGGHSVIAFDFVGSVLVEETEGQLGT